MNYRHQEELGNEEEQNISFDFWKTNYSGHLEKSLRLQQSPFQQDLFEGVYRTEDDLWRAQGFDKNANRRLQNKMNSRRAREKRKGEIEQMRIRIQNLQIQNRNLREKKACRWCHRSLNTFPTHTIQIEKPMTVSSKNCQHNKEELVFEEIKPRHQRLEWRGKLWLAVGLLMLIIGLQMHGFTGSDEKSVRVCSKEAKEWASQLENQNIDNLKIRMKTKTSGSMNEKKWQGNKVKQKQNWLNSISFESEADFLEEERDEELSEININKDLLFSIQAQFDDIGRYI